MSNPLKDPVYVVTRGGRRVEADNHLSIKYAQTRASKLISMIQAFDKSSSKNLVEIKKTTVPHRIR